jgi:hypothetical protein
MHDNSFPGNAGYQPRMPDYQQDGYSWPGQQPPLGGLVNGPGNPQGGYSQGPSYGPNYGPNYGMPPAQPPVRKRKRKRPGKRGAIIFAVGAIAFLAIVIVATSGSGSNGTAAGSSSVSSAVPSSSSAVAQALATAQPTTQAPTTPSMTASQQQAADSAQSYLSEGQGFSKQGLLNQLTSSAGEGFAKSDAEFAISYLHPDWNQQAVDSAQSYLSEGQGFSKQGLLNQLTSSAGEGFTESQAEYAISYLHPDWNAQAVDSAKGYLQLGGFSRASLIQQLTSSAGEGFTEAQAEYAVNKVGM